MTIYPLQLNGLQKWSVSTYCCPSGCEGSEGNPLVYGLGDFSGSDELVTALLADPLAGEDQFEALRSRWDPSSTTVDIGLVDS